MSPDGGELESRDPDFAHWAHCVSKQIRDHGLGVTRAHIRRTTEKRDMEHARYFLSFMIVQLTYVTCIDLNNEVSERTMQLIEDAGKIRSKRGAASVAAHVNLQTASATKLQVVNIIVNLAIEMASLTLIDHESVRGQEPN